MRYSLVEEKAQASDEDSVMNRLSSGGGAAKPAMAASASASSTVAAGRPPGPERGASEGGSSYSSGFEGEEEGGQQQQQQQQLRDQRVAQLPTTHSDEASEAFKKGDDKAAAAGEAGHTSTSFRAQSQPPSAATPASTSAAPAAPGSVSAGEGGPGKIEGDLSEASFSFPSAQPPSGHATTSTNGVEATAEGLELDSPAGAAGIGSSAANRHQPPSTSTVGKGVVGGAEEEGKGSPRRRLQQLAAARLAAVHPSQGPFRRFVLSVEIRSFQV